MQKIISIKLNILFHFYRKHKKRISELRIWFIAKHILDDNGVGSVNIRELSKLSNLSLKYLKSVSDNSEIFRGRCDERLYYVSSSNLQKKHKLRNGKVRGDKLTKKFVSQFSSLKKFWGFITKCYVECDLDPRLKRKFTKGRISYQMIAKYFHISRNTAITNIKNSTAKYFRNIKEYPSITFENKNEFGNWLLVNMDKKIGDYIIGNNPKSYKLKFVGGSYILIQELPHIYKFTGVFFAGASSKGQC